MTLQVIVAVDPDYLPDYLSVSYDYDISHYLYTATINLKIN